MEHERKRLLILTDTYKQTQETLQEIKDKIDEKINENQEEVETSGGVKIDADVASFVLRLYPEPKKIKTEDHEKAFLKSLKHRLEHEKVLLNNIKGDNKELRNNIDSMRREISFAVESTHRMEAAIK